MKRHIFICGLILYLLVSNSRISAQPIDSTQNLSIINIQSDRIYLSYSDLNRDVFVLKSEDIKKLPVSSLTELLAYVPGIDIRQRGPWGGQTDISINGGTFDQVLVMVNGVKVIDPQTGHNMMNLPISPDIIDRIEVVRGAAASYYGINALSGAINIITKHEAENSLSAHISFGSSFEKDSSNNETYVGSNFNLNGNLKYKNSAHLFSVSSQLSSGYRYNTASENSKIFYQSKIRLKKHNKIQMMAGYVNNDFGANGFYAAPADIESKETVQTGVGAITGDFNITKKWNLIPSVSYRYGFDDYIFVRKDPSIYRNKHETHFAEGALRNTIYDKKLGTLGFGAEYRYEKISSNSLGNWNRDNIGAFINYEMPFHKNFNVKIGSYLNYSQYFGWSIFPSIDAGYRLKDFKIFANAGTGMRIPTYTDWYYNGPSNIGNPDLMPEDAVNYQAGLSYLIHSSDLKGTFEFSGIGFYQITNNFIDWVKDSISQPWKTENFQIIKIPGFTISSNYKFDNHNKSNKNLKFSGTISYTRLQPNVVTNTERPIISHYALENLQDQLIINLRTKIKKKYSFSVTSRYEQRLSYKDYILLDASAGIDIRGINIYVNLNNILNINYIEAGAVPLPGRWLTLGVRSASFF